ncbi:putative secreted protein with PEP-CTERM sorting signal [Pseudoduganella flava]|nr:PEP-CTERM sorting domain-containing protein [Pseudoduganella flava]TWI44806.1 putative secreted protein with PEP-CTERM sorting signal [Pseudoduganella flava]
MQRAATAATAILAAALAAPGAALAATSVATTGFTITYVDGPAPDRWGISLASSGPESSAISLDTLNDDLGPYHGAYDLFGNGTSNGGYHTSTLRIDVQEGYRITNLTLSGSAYGVLAPGELNGVAGVARNDVSLNWVLWETDDYHAAPPVRYLDFDGEHAFASTTGSLPYGRSFYVALLGAAEGYAEAAYDGTDFATSYALGAVRNAQLTVDVAPVPEPATWAMLAAGFALLGWRMGRRSAL